MSDVPNPVGEQPPLPPTFPLFPPAPPVLRQRFSARDFLIGMVAGAFLVVAGLVLMVAAVSFMAGKMVDSTFDTLSAPSFPSESQLPAYGMADANWKLQTLDGGSATLADFHGKVVFVNFWATWCGPCVTEMPAIERLQAMLKDDPVAFVLVSDETAGEIRDFIRKQKWSLTSYRRTDHAPALFKTDGIPSTFIVNPNGLIVFRHVGMGRWDDEATVTFIRHVASAASSQ